MESIAKTIIWIALAVFCVVMAARLVSGCTTVNSTEFHRQQEALRQEEVQRQAARCRELREDLGLEWLQESCTLSQGSGEGHSYACDTIEEYASRCASFHQD